MNPPTMKKVMFAILLFLTINFCYSNNLEIELAPIITTDNIYILANDPHANKRNYIPFLFILRNTSSKPIFIYSENFSEGYSNLSFIILNKGKKIAHLKKIKKMWYRNVISFVEIKPKSCISIPFIASSKIWNRSIEDFKPNYEIQAIYEQKKNFKNKKYNQEQILASYVKRGIISQTTVDNLWSGIITSKKYKLSEVIRGVGALLLWEPAGVKKHQPPSNNKH